MEFGSRGRFFLPGEIRPPDILFEFGFPGCDRIEFTDADSWYEAIRNNTVIALKLSASCAKVFDSSEAAFTCNEHWSIFIIIPHDDRLHQADAFDAFH
jgi:hypothetical protein